MEPGLPEKWSDWTVIEEIGEGGSGTVYSAERTRLGFSEKAAVKVVRIPSPGDDAPGFLFPGDSLPDLEGYYSHNVRSSEKEIQAMIRLRGCPNIVTVFDYDIRKEDGPVWYIYILMELMESHKARQYFHGE